MVVTSGGANAHPSGIPDCIQDFSEVGVAKIFSFLKEIIIVFEELSPTIGDSTMQFYLSMRNRDSKMDA